MPVPWPDDARDALLALLGAGSTAIGVWEALDQEGLLIPLIPDGERVRNRPQRNPLHRFTVDRHLVETAVNAAALTRDVARPDLLREAMTHRSAIHSRGRVRGRGSNERMEFIGDRVLGLVIAEWLAERFPR